jgi:hypothetical protein
MISRGDFRMMIDRLQNCTNCGLVRKPQVGDAKIFVLGNPAED